MKLVTFTVDMRPWRAGDHVPLPDDVAARVVASGEAENLRPWPENSAAGAPKEASDEPPARARGTYQTKRGV